VAAACHQVHGAIGFTQEHVLHYFTRRLWSWRDEFGSEAWWNRRLGTIACSQGADAFWPAVTRL
jgi:acyl-CoA dehydrogenase